MILSFASPYQLIHPVAAVPPADSGQMLNGFYAEWLPGLLAVPVPQKHNIKGKGDGTELVFNLFLLLLINNIDN